MTYSNCYVFLNLKGYHFLDRALCFIFRAFEKFSTYCDDCLSMLPITWILGFYVSQVVTRWQDTFKEIPAPTRLALLLTASLQGQDEVCRLTRRTVVRYVCLGFVLTMVSISPAVKKRFPTLDHITKAGMLSFNSLFPRFHFRFMVH
jgi:bestrophin, other